MRHPFDARFCRFDIPAGAVQDDGLPEDAMWAHVIREAETDEPTLLDDEAVAVVNRALSVYGSTHRLERTWIQPGPPLHDPQEPERP